MVRPARPADVAAVAEVASASYRAAFGAILDDAHLALRTPDSFLPRFTAALDRLRVAEAGGAVVGFALATATHLDMLFVDPAAQGMGAGGALLAEAAGRGVCSLECFRANAPARAFYERAGWVVTRGYSRPFAGRLHGFVFYERNLGLRGAASL